MHSKNVDRVLPNHRLNWAAYILGKRESRRLLGDVILRMDDLQHDRRFPDGCVPTGWSNDIHHADPKYNQGFEGDAFISKADFGKFPAHTQQRPFWIPYRALYSRNIANLLMAGRCISVHHDALGAVRVMRTGGCEGEIIGMAASLCKRHQTDPRGVYAEHLDDLQDLMSRGIGKQPATDTPGPGPGQPVRLSVPSWLKSAGANLARTATVRIPGEPAAAVKTYLLLNDGNGKVQDNSGRWICREAVPHLVEFHWDQPVTVGAARIISGYSTGSDVIAPIQDFALQWHDGEAWQDTGVDVVGNTRIGWAARFPPVQTTRVRLVVNKTKDAISRIWEVEFYPPLDGRGSSQ